MTATLRFLRLWLCFAGAAKVLSPRGARLWHAESTLASASHDAAAEAQLVERCRRGDTSAFDDIVARHQNRIYNLCYWMLGDRDEAADAAQDAFVRAFRSLRKFRGDCALATWLHRIAVNVTLDAIARRKRAPLPYSEFDSGDEANAEFDPPDASEAPEAQVARRERQRAVRAALARLPEHHRVVLVLFDIQGYKYEDAAAALELPLGTVKSRLNRARLALREALEPQRELFND